MSDKPRTVSTSVYLHLEPRRNRSGEVVGVSVVRMTKNQGDRGYPQIKVNLEVPASALDAFTAEVGIEVPDTAVLRPTVTVDVPEIETEPHSNE